MEQFWSDVSFYMQFTWLLIIGCYVLTAILLGIGISETINARVHKSERALSTGWRVSLYAASTVLGGIITWFVVYLQH